MPAVAIAPGRPGDEGVRALIAAADALGLALYGPAGYFALPIERIADERTMFLVARDPDGRAVGTAALVDHGDGTGELKRMFVAESARGLGAGSALLAAVERAARECGIRSLVLETGPAQPEAIALYESAGFAHVPLFGPYVGSTDSVCMAKDL
ncbi:GNAT family N-acetyltransferase [Galbitalea sp. SE-J8]|nr:GNAT family N-acetyltransferase [Galbitalea sp. SE-J8]MDM4762209.1 GNAT family N-acetyltransferase [Galbitalea sp. SE-J8]